MAVLIGGASINEFGTLEGGKPGDQTGKEVYVQDWYLHSKGWVVIRAKNPTMRLKIAQDIRWGCANEWVGYSYWDHCYTLYNEAAKYNFDYSKVKTPCETNCAKFVLGACKYAGSKVKDFNTGNEVAMFKETGEFDIFMDEKHCKSDKWLMEGDILVTASKGHTVVVLSDGSMIKDAVPYITANCAFCNVRDGGSVNHKVIETLKGGTRVSLIGWADSGWGEVITPSIHTGYISPIYLEELLKARASGDCWLRDKAGVDEGKRLVTIPKDAIVHLTGDSEMVGKTIWYGVIYHGTEGYASGKYIKPIK